MRNGTFCRVRLLAAATAVLWLRAPVRSDDLPPEILALAEASRQFRQDATVLSSFACLETIDRAESDGKSGKLRHVDRVDLEVTKIGSQEWFSWPGGDSFHEDPARMIGHGMAGSGEFLVTAQSALNGSHPIAFVDTTQVDGRKAYRYKYEISSFASRYHVRSLMGDDDIGVRGDVWIDAETLDVLRVSAEGWQMPGSLGLQSLQTIVSYARIPINQQPLLFPQSAETTMRYTSGRSVMNTIEFSHCRSYQTSSRLLAEGEATNAPPPELNPLVELPPELRIQLELATRIDTRSKVGTPIEAKLMDRLRLKGSSLVVPAGAHVRGRVRRLRPCVHSKDCWEVSIEFNEIVTPDHRFRFAARFLNASPVNGLSASLRTETEVDRNLGDWTQSTISTMTTTLLDLPGTASFFLTKPPFQVPVGTLTNWVTIKPKVPK